MMTYACLFLSLISWKLKSSTVLALNLIKITLDDPHLFFTITYKDWLCILKFVSGFINLQLNSAFQ